MMYFPGFHPRLGFVGGWVLCFIIILAWCFVWKGAALWRAARNNHKPWFVVLLLVNTMGLLEILYLFVLSKKEKK